MSTFGGTVDGTGNINTVSANTIAVSKYTTGGTGLTVTHGHAFLSGSTATGKAIFVIYAADGTGGIPGTLLGSSREISGVRLGQKSTFVFDTPVVLSAGTTYWLGIHADTACNYAYTNFASGNQYTVSRAYTSGPLSPWSGGSAGFYRQPVYVDDVATVSGSLVTQEILETISSSNPNAVVTELAIEAISSNSFYAILSQFGIETLSTNVPDETAGTQRPSLFIIT